MPDQNEQPDVILRQRLAVARNEYAELAKRDRKTFDLDAAFELIFNMTGPAPQATAQWMRTLADGIELERRGGDRAAQRKAYEEAYTVLRETLTKPTITN